MPQTKESVTLEFAKKNGLGVLIPSLPDGDYVHLDPNEIPEKAFDEEGNLVNENLLLDVARTKLRK